MTRGVKAKKLRQTTRKEFRHFLKHVHMLGLKDRIWLAWKLIYKPRR